jgi:hypothetical protein
LKIAYSSRLTFPQALKRVNMGAAEGQKKPNTGCV